MKTVDYNALATSAPVNRDAALARDGHGERYECKIQECREHWKAPPKLSRRPSDKEDLSGRKFGRFVVIGYLRSHKGGSRWLVRCSCGDYEVRTSKAIRNPGNSRDCCYECHRLALIRKRQDWLRTGKQRDTQEYL